MKRVVLPVETKVRELNGKLWLAAHLAQRGYRVALGELSYVKSNLDRLKPNIYVGDSTVFKDSRINLYQRLQKANAFVAVHDTEGGIIYSHEYYKGRLSKEVLPYVDCFLAWGNETADILKEVWETSGMVLAAVGNPAFDLLSRSYRQFYKSEKERIIRKFGQFVLINTHFGFYNHYDVEKHVLPLRKKFPGLYTFKKELFFHFIEAIEKLSELNSQINFVIRPHPSENFDQYRTLFSNKNNVYVEHDLSVHPWLQAARLIIHNGCTTGVESALLERPVISYRPATSEQWDVYLPNFLSQEAKDTTQLQAFIDQYCSDDQQINIPLNSNKRKVVENILNFQDGRSAERIADAFDRLNIDPDKPVGLINRTSFENRTKNLLHSIRNCFLPMEGNKLVKGYAEQKFSHISLLEIDSLLTKFKEINTELEDVTINEIDGMENLFWVSLNS